MLKINFKYHGNLCSVNAYQFLISITKPCLMSDMSFQPVLVYMSKVDGRFKFSPISVNFLTEVAKVIFAIAMLIFQVLLPIRSLQWPELCVLYYYIIFHTIIKQLYCTKRWKILWKRENGKLWSLHFIVKVMRDEKSLMIFSHNYYINEYGIFEYHFITKLFHFKFSTTVRSLRFSMGGLMVQY